MYFKRVVDDLLYAELKSSGAVLIEGPKWCGKTTSAEHLSKSSIHLDDDSDNFQNLQLAQSNPHYALRGDTPRLVDEWQLAPMIWSAVRSEVDKRDKVGQFILTGSSVPLDQKKLLHSGTGRISSLLMYPMSLSESDESSKEVSLSQLFDNPESSIGGSSNIDMERMAFLLCRGGWPGVFKVEEGYQLKTAINYVKEVVERDINRVGETKRKSEIAERILKSYARNESSEISDDKIAIDANVSTPTAVNYLSAFSALFIINELKAWNPNLRSRVAIRSANVRHFVDPSLATASLRIGPGDLMKDLNTFGLLFESMVIRDLRIYVSKLDGDIFHYRDKSGLECDAVIHLRNGKYALAEVKLASQVGIDEGASHLLKIKDKIDTDKMGKPSFLMVITATRSAYRRSDGVIVCPLSCLTA